MSPSQLHWCVCPRNGTRRSTWHSPGGSSHLSSGVSLPLPTSCAAQGVLCSKSPNFRKLPVSFLPSHCQSVPFSLLNREVNYGGKKPFIAGIPKSQQCTGKGTQDPPSCPHCLHVRVEADFLSQRQRALLLPWFPLDLQHDPLDYRNWGCVYG